MRLLSEELVAGQADPGSDPENPNSFAMRRKHRGSNPTRILEAKSGEKYPKLFLGRNSCGVLPANNDINVGFNHQAFFCVVLDFHQPGK